MQLYGWGRYPRIEADFLEPLSEAALQNILADGNNPLIVRGGGKSYGDAALADTVVSSRFLDNFLQFDLASGAIRCGAGVTMEEILKVAIPHGYVVPTLPGTRHVTLGGAIAADIHGKNHHQDGSFCDHLERFSLMLANGEVIECDRNQNSEAFLATCGGMGLTGMILEATLKLHKVPSVSIKQRSIAAGNLSECIEIIEANNSSKYSVAWVDCLAKGAELGRSVVHLGEHSDEGSQEFHTRWGPSIPFSTPAFLLNRYSTRLFNNSLYGLRKRTQKTKIVNYDAYFFPLDNIKNWNRLYGRNGFLQYQLVLPLETAEEGLAEILKVVSESGKGSFISVLKKFGTANENLLSFPKAGYTLTLDFKNESKVFPLLDRLDEIVLANSGRLYLAKDARMSKEVFQASYENWEKFREIKTQLDPNGRFASHMSSRLGLS